MLTVPNVKCRIFTGTDSESSVAAHPSWLIFERRSTYGKKKGSKVIGATTCGTTEKKQETGRHQPLAKFSL